MLRNTPNLTSIKITYTTYLSILSPIFNGRQYERVFSTITKETFKHIKIEVSDITTQKKIANTLGAIGRENRTKPQNERNARTNGAGALFRHYFIDNPEAKKWERKITR